MINRQFNYSVAQETWQLRTSEQPIPQPTDLLIKVTASSLNPIDLKRRAQSDLPVGYDGAGTIVALGTEVTTFEIGQSVYYTGTLQRAGSFQDYQLVAAANAALLPTTVPLADSAGLPLVSLTAFELLFEKFGFIPQKGANSGQKLLIVNGAGGVGSIMSQLAKWAGITVYATASPQHFDWLRQHGVHSPLDYHETGLAPRLNQLAADQFDAIAVLYDSTRYFDRLVPLLKPFGHFGTIVSLSGALDLNLLKDKSASFDWESMFTKTNFNFNVASQGASLQTITELIDAGEISPFTTKVYPEFSVETLSAASDLLAQGHLNGKIVLLH